MEVLEEERISCNTTALLNTRAMRGRHRAEKNPMHEAGNLHTCKQICKGRVLLQHPLTSQGLPCEVLHSPDRSTDITNRAMVLQAMSHSAMETFLFNIVVSILLTTLCFCAALGAEDCVEATD